MNILITGVEGFVGRYIVEMLPEYFKDADRICGTYLSSAAPLDHLKGIELYELDITDDKKVNEVIEKTKPDYIFHLAAQSSVGLSWKKPQLTMDVNINGTINLLNAVKEVNKDCKVLIIGSSEQYGKIEVLPVNEKHRLDPQNPYSISKVTQEMIAEMYVKAFKMNIYLTRSFNHIGPYQEPLFVVPDWAKQIADIEKGLKEPVMYVGNTKVKRDFTDVRDIVEAYMYLIKCGVSGEIYNIGSGKAFSLENILEILLSLSKVKIEVKVDESKLRPAENEVIECDFTKINELCGWKPRHKVEETLLDTLDYWRNK